MDSFYLFFLINKLKKRIILPSFKTLFCISYVSLLKEIINAAKRDKYF